MRAIFRGYNWRLLAAITLICHPRSKTTCGVILAGQPRPKRLDLKGTEM